MRFLVIGSGGREHALAWRLMTDGSAREVFVAPGNGGIDDAFRADIEVNDFRGIEKFCSDRKIDMVVVGPEAPLVDGLVDYLAKKNIPAFGPCAGAAMLEGSKLFAKSIMEKYGVPTGSHADFTSKDGLINHVRSLKNYPIVIKLDGLAAGKGVAIPGNLAEAMAFIEENVKDGCRVFVEEFLEGEEASVLGISDGETVLPFVAAQDHKRVFDGDRGPNTGGMGAYAPAPVVTAALLEKVCAAVLQPTVDGMKKEGAPFKGILYAGLIIKGDAIRVLEYNARFGDPETQVILPLLDGRLGDYFQASVSGGLKGMSLRFRNEHAITVVMASGGYPGNYAKGMEITGLDRMDNDVIVFHAGTKRQGDRLVTAGGRVLNVTAAGKTLIEAREKVYGRIGKIFFDGCFYRRDIAHRALGRA